MLRILMLALGLTLALPALAQTPPPPPARPAPAPPPQYQPAPVPKAAAPAPVAIAHIDRARQLWREGKLLQTLDELDLASGVLNRQLGRTFAPTLPSAPPGWAVEPPDPQRAAATGGAAAIRDYRQTGGAAGSRGQMSARIVLDPGAAQAMQPLFQPQMPQGVPATVRKVRVNNQDAVVAYDPQRRAGEVSMIVGNRILVQVEGQNVASAEPMLAAMRQWNLAELRRLAGL